ncbi:hypothetical protein L208DRAFT_1397675 [Tricholoma matsutake]|nr:hypothetical protein L208DRAFT_1397675 [Tricholoma matsutake 945]
MNSALQARIHELESTLARLLHERGREDGGQPKSMVDLTMWMSSPDHALKAVASHSSAETPRGSRIIALPLAVSAVTSSATIDPALLALPSFATTAISVPDAAPSSAPRVTNKPIPKSKMSKLTGVNETKVTTSRTTQKSKATKTFSTLAASDFDSDSEDDTPLSELSDYLSVLGKRARAVSPAKVEKPRVTRRSV